ncbi:hypothetical protein BDP27DRAFT_1312167 [Rhodocollybia butyracea]|uniref:Uncharacterized protein n=1 Tax=Rhodocollybia butyracea TaxID=206335 RepID=A0A9P5Q9T3_9AGAR|nr:hypothetical protein BDP27DRAFT_1312167 [Rhodocollybia butyracea]
MDKHSNSHSQSILAKESDTQQLEPFRSYSDDRVALQERQLFTPASNFYSRELPPLGVRACNLNGADEKNFAINQVVLIRKFEEHTSQWTEWVHAKVIKIEVVRGYVGNYAKRYIVESRCPITGEPKISGHLPFLFEIWPASSPPAYYKHRDRANHVYAWSQGIVHPKNQKRIWFPALVIEWERNKNEQENEIKVQCLANAYIGKHFLADKVLPYTHETWFACLRQGDLVMQPNGLVDRNMNFKD